MKYYFGCNIDLDAGLEFTFFVQENILGVFYYLVVQYDRGAVSFPIETGWGWPILDVFLLQFALEDPMRIQIFAVRIYRYFHFSPAYQHNPGRPRLLKRTYGK